MKLLFVTGNKYKFNEAKHALPGIELEQMTLDIEEIQSLSVPEVAEAKARAAYEKLRRPLIVEDTGIGLSALNGFPGALGKWLEDSLGDEGFCALAKAMGNAKASAETCVCMFDGAAHLFTSRIEGTISETPRGSNGFGWDKVFVPNGHNRTMGEMTLEEKNSISMRASAFKKLEAYLAKSH